jgi:hypothetical protein
MFAPGRHEGGNKNDGKELRHYSSNYLEELWGGRREGRGDTVRIDSFLPEFGLGRSQMKITTCTVLSVGSMI